MDLPNAAMGDGRTRVFLAVLAGHCRYDALMRVTGLSRQPLHRHLHALRREGLVDFEDYQKGTLRALVAPIAEFPPTQEVAADVRST